MKYARLARWTSVAAILLTAQLPAAALNLPFGLDSSSADRQDFIGPVAAPAPKRSEGAIRMAQAGDPVERINQLEEANRRLTGRIEELSFQLLQMQEQARKTQEDNEFRFKELEGGKSAGGAAPQKRSDAAPAAPPGGGADAAAAPPADASGAAAPGIGDDIGNLLGSSQLDPAPAPAATTPPAKAGSGTVASVPSETASGLYVLAYNYLLAGDYKLAEDSFRQYAQTYPDAADVPDAQYWLGESQYAQAKYTDAAETFLNAQKAHPKSSKAPEMMLKLGMSLVKLDSRDTACATFKEIGKRYPQMSANVKRKLQAETTAASC